VSGFRLEKVLPRRKKALSEADAAAIRAVFAEENRKLDLCFGLGINRHGYY
jgi:hypothetical protein